MFGSSRRNARIIAFQIIYQRAKIGVRQEEEKLFFERIGFSKNYRLFSQELIDVAWREKETIDKTIQKHLFKWKQNRILENLNALLKVSVAELLFFPKTDAKIVFNEAIEICREYVSEKATKICNGTLHAVWRSANPDASQAAEKSDETEITSVQDAKKITEDKQKPKPESLEAMKDAPEISQKETPEILKEAEDGASEALKKETPAVLEKRVLKDETKNDPASRF